MTAEAIFANAAVAAGCPMDQTFNLVRAECWLQERQLVASAAARLCDGADGPTAIGYGGARGGGKSHWLLAQSVKRKRGADCLRFLVATKRRAVLQRKLRGA